MALKATVFKLNLEVADMRRHLYQSYPLTIAQHPSETSRRTMLRLLAFAVNASDSLQFTRGLCVDDEPELWQKSLAGDIELWIELGLPDEKRLKKASRRANRVVLYAYGSAFSVWWPENRAKLALLNNLDVFYLQETASQSLADLLERNMQLHCSIDDEQIWLSSQSRNIMIELEHHQVNTKISRY
jgi:uncharacterized protein YaeQ